MSGEVCVTVTFRDLLSHRWLALLGPRVRLPALIRGRCHEIFSYFLFTKCVSVSLRICRAVQNFVFFCFIFSLIPLNTPLFLLNSPLFSNLSSFLNSPLIFFNSPLFLNPPLFPLISPLFLILLFFS